MNPEKHPEVTDLGRYRAERKPKQGSQLTPDEVKRRLTGQSDTDIFMRFSGGDAAALHEAAGLVGLTPEEFLARAAGLAITAQKLHIQGVRGEIVDFISGIMKSSRLPSGGDIAGLPAPAPDSGSQQPDLPIA